MNSKIAFLLLAAALAGCVAGPSPQMRDAFQYVRTHKGEGTRGVIPAGFETAYQGFAKSLNTTCHEDTYRVTQLPMAKVLYADCRPTASTSMSWAVWFNPGDDPEQTQVEVLLASEWLQPAVRRKYESDLIREVQAAVRPEAGAPAPGPDSGPGLRRSLEDIQKMLQEE